MAQGQLVYVFVLVVWLFSWDVCSQYCEEASSCCACVSTAGCSWFYNASLPAPFCREMPYREFPVDPSLELRTPASFYSSEYLTMRNEPINVARGRLLQPQEFSVKLNVGSRQELNFNVLGMARLLRMRVMDGTNNTVNFTVSPQYDNSCPRGFTTKFRAGRGRWSRRLVVRCLREIPRETTKFKVSMDLLSCFSGSKELRVAIVGPGARKYIKISIQANCKCPREINAPLTESLSASSNDDTESVDEGSIQAETMYVCDGGPTSEHGSSCGDNRHCVNHETGETCSGRGSCMCGQCMCNKRSSDQATSHMQLYTGEYCECDDYACPMSDSLLCGGPQRGMCDCGVCRCHPGWAGEACDLNESDMCKPYPSYNGSTCNNHGTCVYGSCVCDSPYAGEFCEDCPWCVNPCNDHIFCVTCLFVDPNSDAEQCHERCSTGDVSFLLVDENSDDENEQVCIFRHRMCYHQFSYRTEENTGLTSVFVSRTQSCNAG